MRLRFLPRYIYGHTAVVAPILQRRLSVEIHKLKYILKSLKPLKYLIFNETNIFRLLEANLFVPS